MITNKPYVLDFEHFWALSFGTESAYGIIAKKIIKRLFTSKNLKFILPWTYAAYNTIPRDILSSRGIREKIKVVYPAVPPQETPKKRNTIQ